MRCLTMNQVNIVRVSVLAAKVIGGAQRQHLSCHDPSSCRQGVCLLHRVRRKNKGSLGLPMSAIPKDNL